MFDPVSVEPLAGLLAICLRPISFALGDAVRDTVLGRLAFRFVSIGAFAGQSKVHNLSHATARW
jgi:hypothetical protein